MIERRKPEPPRYIPPQPERIDYIAEAFEYAKQVEKVGEMKCLVLVKPYRK